MKAERPRIRIDDAWHYAVEDMLTGRRYTLSRRVVAVTADSIITAQSTDDPAGASGRFVYTAEWNLVERPALGGAENGVWKWSPHYPHFRFPLEAGKSWNGRAVTANEATDTRNEHRYTATVQRLRRVTVPAGTFDTLPVLYQAEVISQDTQQQLAWKLIETLDYAPDVDGIVQYASRTLGPSGKASRDTVLRLTRRVR